MLYAIDNLTDHRLSLLDDLILLLFNEHSGYFHQVPGWDLNCAAVGAVLAELSLQTRIDTDMESLFIIDKTETGDPALDPILKEIADDPVRRNTQYWIEKLSVHAESIIDLTLDRLVELNILEHHDGEFWTLVPASKYANAQGNSTPDTISQLIKSRISEVILTDTIPGPRDIIIICLVNTCDVFRYMFELDEQAEERIELICRMDLIGRSIATAVEHSITNPLLQRSHLAKKIPTVSLSKLLLNRNLHQGNVPALFADLTKQYGHVFEIRPPFKKPLVFLSGKQTNYWVHRNGRMHLSAKRYFADFEKVYGANGVLPSLDGAEHFRLRRAMSSAYSRQRFSGQLEQVYQYARNFMSDWKVGDSYPATLMCRKFINAQISPIMVSVDSQDIVENLITYKERALNTHMMKALPKFMLRTPKMKKQAKYIDTLMERIQSAQTPAQRAGCPRNLADDLLSLNASDPQLVPEANLRFGLSAALIASVYLGDALSFTIYAMASQPALYEQIRSEADKLFGNGDPENDDFDASAADVTRRFIKECLRMYPIVPASVRDVVNACVVEGYELPVGTRVVIAQTATHYMEEHFPDPYKFDIDRYSAPTNADRGFGYAPYGLGTHTCLGSKWMDLQLLVNILIIAHYFRIKVYPDNYKLRFDPLPSMKPNKKLKFLIAEQNRELPA